MQIGDVIRKYRKNKNMTQEEMAKRLGVTAPAENGNTYPDITLLSPIARLLNISLDTLLKHQKELSDTEANRLVEEALEKLKTEPFADVFKWMKQCFIEYPNSSFLILWMTRVADSQRQMMDIPDQEQYDSYILDCYQRVLESEDEKLRSDAAESLYHFYMNKEEYIKAEAYLIYFSQENPERKRKQARIFSKTGRRDEALKAFEELLYEGYHNLNTTLHDVYIVAMEEKDHDKVRMFVNKIQNLAALFEFGEYHEISPALELAAVEKNEGETLRIMERMLANLESIFAFTKSPLYAHMEFKAPNDAYLTQLREDVLKGFRDEETFAFLKENKRWRELVGF